MENNLLTREDIESADFIYEPDASKCKTRKIRMHYDCNYYQSGSWEHRTTPEITPEWKEACKKALLRDAYYWSHIHDVFVPPIAPLQGQGVMCRWVMIRGHGDELSKKWYGTGLLEGLKPKDFSEASDYLNRVAQELIDKTKEVTFESPNFNQLSVFPGIVLPVARIFFDKYKISIEPKFVVEDILRFYDDNKQLYEELKNGIAQDHELEFIELYISKFEGTPMIAGT